MAQPPPYDPKVPTSPSESLATTQPNMLNNFLQLFNKMAVNHVPLDAASAGGNHTIIELLEQTNTPQTDIGEISVYVKEAKVGEDEEGIDQVFIKYQGNPGQEFQLTAYQIYGLQPSATDISYFTILPGRIIVYFGQIIKLNAFQELNVLNLFPPIAKNIITVSHCGIGPNANLTPKLSVNPIQVRGFYSRVRFGDPGLQLTPIQNYFYLVMANI